MSQIPVRDGPATSVAERADVGGRDWDDMASVPEGTFLMGSEDRYASPGDGEGPVRPVRLASFRIGIYAVTNAQFARFVDESGYVTEAERLGSSLVFAGLLADADEPDAGVGRAPWWRQVAGADWRHPEGPSSDLDGRQSHPVVHVTWNDAWAYVTAAGLRLPTESEWECAARGGLVGLPFPWGDELEPGGTHRMNVWQGTFPRENTRADGYYGTAPVDAYAPNAYGLYNVTGNTWEWCADWFTRDVNPRARRLNPRGPLGGTHKALRGGSYLSQAPHCRSYRVSARTGLTPDTSRGDVGFRCAAPIRRR